ncbi:MAG: hypothetical protein U0992_01425 [Planctomycetaceae bacterium]
MRSYLSKSVVLPLPSPPRSEPPETPHAVDRLVDCAASLTDPRLQRLLLRAGEALLDTGPRSAVTRVQ